MKAMNGFGTSGAGRSWRLLGCLAALVALSAMLVAPSLASAKKAKPVKATYVGLGDSLAFGYSQELFNLNKPGENPAAFEHGYVTDYFNLINAKKQTQLINYGCPGETTESLIGNNPTFLAELNTKAGRKVQEPITGESPCAYHKVGLPLHNEYGAGKSQLEAALAAIALGKTDGKPVKTISLDIGANDELHAISKIEAEAAAKVEFEVKEGIVPLLVAAHLQDEVIKTVVPGQVEAFVVEQVIPQAYGESGGEEPAFKEDIEKDAGEYFATHGPQLEALEAQLVGEDEGPYGAEHKAELEAYGLEQAGIYVTTHQAELKALGEKFGHELLVAGVPALFEQIDTNVIGILTAIHDTGFKGRVIFVGTYNPYGRVGGVSTGHKELQPGDNALALQLVALEKATFTKKALKVKSCYSNSLALFNPAAGNETLPAEELEEVQLATWTNMANFNVFEGKTFGQSGADGPDIHATPLGYEKMAGLMHTTCG
jgi:hypothetical protein